MENPCFEISILASGSRGEEWKKKERGKNGKELI